jgi:hypothetical protein
MKRPVLIALAAAVLVGLPVAYWLISPLFITREVNESVADIPNQVVQQPAPSPSSQVGAPTADIETEVPPPPMPAPEGPTVVAQGSFVGQAFHEGEGTVTLLEVDGKHFVRFESDFKVTNGPDLFVYFGKDGAYVDAARIAELKGNVGGQNYVVPSGIDVADYNEVWIWCRAFSVPFARAVLE